MMKIGVIILLAAAAPKLWATSCLEAGRERKTENRQLKGFKTLFVKGSLDVEVHKAEESYIKISGPENFLPEVKTSVVGSELRISHEGCFVGSGQLKILVYTSDLKLKAVAGQDSAEIQLFDALAADQAEIRISGSGDIKGDVKTKKLELSIVGSGDMNFQGSADTLDVSIAGSGHLEARKLIAKDVSITIAGTGDANVNAIEALKIEINGSGGVNYTGDPKKKKFSSHGSARIEAL